MNYILAFVVGGLLCVVGQLLIDFTKLTPARILVGYVVAGVGLGGLGVFSYIAQLGGSGATVPLLGFGNVIAQGVRKAVDETGLLGAFTGGLTASAGGITVTIVCAFLAGILAKSKDQS